MTGPTREQVADLLEDLVATPSPSGQEAKAAELLADHLADWGLETWTDAAGNVHAAKGPETAPRILSLGHIDTVPGQPPVRWEDDVLWGRGAVDAKGPLVAHATALASLDDPDARVELVAAVGEETDSPGARHLVDNEPPPAALLIAEPTGSSTVGLGYKGRLVAHLDATARPAHPGADVPTAAERLVDAIQALTKWTGNPDRDPGFKETTLRVTDLSTQAQAEVARARARLDLRFPGDAPDREELRACLADEVELSVEEAVAAVRVPARDPVATALRGALTASGRSARHVVKTGTSDWNVVAPRWGCPAAAYGPGDPELDHTPDEHIGLDDVLEAASILQDALGRLPQHLPASTAEQA